MSILTSFLKPEGCSRTVFPDMSFWIGQKMVKNAIFLKVKCELLRSQEFLKKAENGKFWLWSNSVTWQVNFKRTKNGGKCQRFKKVIHMLSCKNIFRAKIWNFHFGFRFCLFKEKGLRRNSGWKSPKMSHLKFSILAFLVNFWPRKM